MAVQDAPAASPPLPLVLEYRAPAEQELGALRRPRWLAILLLLIAASIAAVPFCDFTYGVSPLYAVRYTCDRLLNQSRGQELMLVLMALPFFLGIPIGLWQARLLMSRKITFAECVIAYALASLAVVCSVVFFAYFQYAVRGNSNRWDMQSLAMYSVPAALLAGTGLLCFALVRRLPSHVIITIVLYTAYLTNSILCLAVWADARDSGWWLALVGSGGLLADLLLVLFQMLKRGRTSNLRALPSAL